MATIAKFYLLDALTPNTGTMPGSGDAFANNLDSTGDATGARTARDATDVAGTSNPDIEASITANADQTAQAWGYRRFVSRPLAAQNVPAVTWTFSYARSESNLNHNQAVQCLGYAWRPSTGLKVGGNIFQISGTEPTAAATEQAESVTNSTGLAIDILDGDILVFEVSDSFTQGMSTAYTSQFAYDGTTEASTTTCASFVTPPSALTLFTPVPPYSPQPLLITLASLMGLRVPILAFPSPSVVVAPQTFFQTLTTSVSTTATMSRIVNKILTTSASLTATMSRIVNKILTTSVSTTATMARTALKILTTNVSTTATMVRSVLKVLTATVTMTASLTASKIWALTLTTSVTLSATMVRTVQKVLTTNVTIAATMSRIVAKVLTTNVTLAANMVRTILKTLTTTVTSAASLTALKVILVTLTASVTLAASLVATFVAGALARLRSLMGVGQ